MKTLPAVDVLIIGGGWSGLLMAKELGSHTSLSILVLERGPSRESADYANSMDELDYAIRLHMMQDLSQDTVTFRHNANKRALPLRQHGSFLPGAGVGGSGIGGMAAGVGAPTMSRRVGPTSTSATGSSTTRGPRPGTAMTSGTRICSSKRSVPWK